MNIEPKGEAINIPGNWYDFYNKSAHFFTYFGEVYYGFLAKCPEFDDRIYIIQNDRIKEWKELKGQNRTPESYRKLGWEIKDCGIIREINAHESLGGTIQLHQPFLNDSRYKKMFVFGADASAFCAFGKEKALLNNFQYKPPLGNQLFDENYDDIIKHYQGAELTLPAYLATNNDIEKLLEKEWNNIITSKNLNLLKRHINIQFYIQKLISQVSIQVISNFKRANLYSLLATSLQQYYSRKSKEKGIFVTFNYDTILDHFIERAFSHPFKSMKDYYRYDSNFLYFKPHGSCNWGWKINESRFNKLGRSNSTANIIYDKNLDLYDLYFNYLGDLKENLADNSWGFESSLHKERLGKFTINKNRMEVLHDERFYPSLLLPYGEKDEFVMPYDHHQAMDTVMDQVEELFLIGWKGNEAVFNRQLKQKGGSIKKIIIVDPNHQVVIENLRKEINLNIPIETIKNFEDFVIKYLPKYLNL